MTIINNYTTISLQTSVSERVAKLRRLLLYLISGLSMAFLAALPIVGALAGAGDAAGGAGILASQLKKSSKKSAQQLPPSPIDEARLKEDSLRKISRVRRGRVKTVLTSGQGLGQKPINQQLTKKTLLGGA